MSTSARTSPFLLGALLVALLAGAIGIAGRARRAARTERRRATVTWVRSPEVMRRLALGFDAVLADVYWIRAVQYYGDTKLSTAEKKDYDLLYPLLDITTTLDPRFNIAYRFGASCCRRAIPTEPATPTRRSRCFEKGIRATPERWQYHHDAGFVEYWWRRDNRPRRSGCSKASKLPGAPSWLPRLPQACWPKGAPATPRGRCGRSWRAPPTKTGCATTANRALLQLDAEAAIEQLQPVVNRVSRHHGAASRPAGTTWSAPDSCGGIPLDPSGYALRARSGVGRCGRRTRLAAFSAAAERR